MAVTNIPNFALLSYFTTDRFHYQLYGHLAPVLENDRRDPVELSHFNSAATVLVRFPTICLGGNQK